MGGRESFVRNLKRSWWVLFAAVPFGWLAFASFMYAGRKARRRSWFVIGLFYLFVFWTATVVAAVEDLPSAARQAGGIVMLVGWPLAFIHAMVIRPRYLELTDRDSLVATEATEPPSAAAPEVGHEWDPGWFGGRFKFWGVGAVGALMFVGGVAMFATGDEAGPAISIAAFGAACVLSAPMFRPRHRGGEIHVQVIEDRPLPGVVFPYSQRVTRTAAAGALLMGLALLGMGIDAESFADSGRSIGFVKVVGLAGGAFFALLGVRTLLRAGSASFVALAPDGIHQHLAGSMSFVPWDVITDVRGEDLKMWVRGATVREPFIAVDVGDRRRVEMSKVGRALMRVNKHLLADVAYPVRQLDVDPTLALRAIAFYWKTPDRRHELADRAGVDRILRRDLDLPT